MPSASDFHQYTSSTTIRVIVGTTPRRARHNLYTSLLRDKSVFFREKLANLTATPAHARNNHNNNAAAAATTTTTTNTAHSTQTIFIPEHDSDDSTPSTAKDPTISLPNADPDAFQQYVQWLYAKPFDLTNLHLVVETYLLGHAFNDEEFRNDLTDTVRRYYTNTPTGKIDMSALVKLSEGLPPHVEGNQGKNQLLELLVAQLTFKVLQKGWGNYRENKNFRVLMEGSGAVVMAHLNWLHRLIESAEGGRGGGGGGRRGIKRERGEDGEEGGEDDGDEDGDDVDYAPRGAGGGGATRGIGIGIGIGGGNGRGVARGGRGVYARRPTKKIKGAASMINPAAIKGCMFHEHKARNSKCKSPEDLVGE